MQETTTDLWGVTSHYYILRDHTYAGMLITDAQAVSF